MTDLISRQAAIDALQKEIDKAIPPFDDVIGSIRCGVRLARNIIEDLPSAETAKHGEWIEKMWFHCVYDELPRTAYVCSECHVAFPADDYLVENFRYCPHCGARMEE